MTDSPASRSPFGPLAPVLRRWPLLLLFALAGGVGGFLLFARQSPVFESTARIQVSKRYDSAAAEGRAVYLEDYVATMTQIIASDAVLGETARTLDAAQLAQPLPADDIARLDRLKAALAITRVRDPNAVATSSSSVLSLRYLCDDPGDAKKILDAVIRAVQKYLERGYSDAAKKQADDLSSAIARKGQEKLSREKELIALKDELSKITAEELPLVRARLTTRSGQAFTLRQELLTVEQDLDAIAKIGKEPTVRQAKLRELLGVIRTPGELAAASGPDTVLQQLAARKLEMTERMGKDHPAIKEVDAQVKFYEGLTSAARLPDASDELALYANRLQVKRGLLKLLQDDTLAQIGKDEDVLRRGSVLQDQAELVRRQIDEYTLEIARLRDGQQALAATITAKEAGRAYDARTLDEPRVGRKVGPNLMTWVVPGVLLGVLLAVGLAFLAEMADQSFRDPTEVRAKLGVPVFGHVPPIRTAEPATADVSASYDRVLVAALRPKSAEAEAFRAVRTQLLVATADSGAKLVQITSPNPGDGKSTTAANLAISLAQAGKRVALVDCDFRKPRVHVLFAIPKPEIGLASVVSGASELDAAIRPCDVDNLFLLPCGPRPANPAELLAGERFGEVLAQLREKFDAVVLDTPPLLAVSDPLIVAQRSDAVVLVFGIHRRSRPQVERARELLADAGATLIGAVVNGTGVPSAAYYGSPGGGYKYAYHYEYQYADPYGHDDGEKA